MTLNRIWEMKHYFLLLRLLNRKTFLSAQQFIETIILVMSSLGEKRERAVKLFLRSEALVSEHNPILHLMILLTLTAECNDARVRCSFQYA